MSRLSQERVWSSGAYICRMVIYYGGSCLDFICLFLSAVILRISARPYYSSDVIISRTGTRSSMHVVVVLLLLPTRTRSLVPVVLLVRDSLRRLLLLPVSPRRGAAELRVCYGYTGAIYTYMC